MKVKLLAVTPNPIDVMWTAARTCYSAKSPIEMWEETNEDNTKFNVLEMEKHWNLVKKVLDSGHQSIAEHVYFTFAIEGVNRALTHQLVRHRAGIVFSQQSQRYVNEKDGFEFEVPKSIQDIEELHNEFYALMQHIQNFYNKAIEHNIKPEDARSVLPNAALSNITMSLNYRELIHICNLRLCTRAQKEIRDLVGLIKKEVSKVDEHLALLLVPSCEVNGICFEDKCCGRKPKIEEIKSAYKLLEKDDTILSQDDWNLLMESIDNPKVNEKLQKLMKEPSVLDS